MHDGFSLETRMKTQCCQIFGKEKDMYADGLIYVFVSGNFKIACHLCWLSTAGFGLQHEPVYAKLPSIPLKL